MTLRSRLRVVSLFSAGVIDQILLSGANFIVGFLLIRKTTDANYALFVLVQSGVLLLITAQTAWLSTPLAILSPKLPPERRLEMVGGFRSAQSRFLLRVVPVTFIVPVAAHLLGLLDRLGAVVIGVGLVAGWIALQREYLRRALLIYMQTNALLVADTFYVIVFVAGAALGAYRSVYPVVWATLAVAIAGWISAVAANRAMARNPGWRDGPIDAYLADARRLGKWASMGALSYWLFSQSYNYILATRLDLKAVADVNAARLLITPAIVLTIGTETLLLPKSASWLASVGLRRLLRNLTVLFLAIAAVELLYFAVVWVLRDWLTHDLLRKSIGDRDRLLLLWATIALVGLLRTVFQTALVALERLKRMAAITATGAAASLCVMWFDIGSRGHTGALVGLITGDVVVIAGYTMLLREAWFRHPAPRVQHEGA